MQRASVLIFASLLFLVNLTYSQDFSKREQLNQLRESGVYVAGPARQFYSSAVDNSFIPFNSLDETWDLLHNSELSMPSVYGIARNDTATFFSFWCYSDIQVYYDGTFPVTLHTDLNGIFEIVHDGSNLYCTTGERTLYCLNPVDGTPVYANDIHIPVSESSPASDMKTVTYDYISDTFWAGNSEYVMNFDRGGNILYHGLIENPQFWNNFFPIYGLAFDHDENGTFLYISHASDNSLVNITKLDLENDFEILESIDASMYVDDYSVSGGLYIDNEYDERYRTLMHIVQGDQGNLLYLELEEIALAQAPGSVENFLVNPDLSGALSAELYWINPNRQINGAYINDPIDINIYRDDELLYTLEDSQPGQANTYVDEAIQERGFYNYRILAVNDAGQGLPASRTQLVGEDVPDKVLDLEVDQLPGGSIFLSWINPLVGLNRSAFNNPIAGYVITRSDGESFHLGGIHNNFMDSTSPQAGFYSYVVQPYNSIGIGGFNESEVIFISSGGVLIYENFENGIQDYWYAQGDSIDSWELSNYSNYAGCSPPELMLDCGLNNFIGTTRYCAGPFDTRGIANVILEFNHNVSHWYNGYSLGVATSSDNIDWNTVWEISPEDNIEAARESIVIDSDDIGSATFYLSFYFDGYSYLINGWFLDDIFLHGQFYEEGIPSQPENVSIQPDQTGENQVELTWQEPHLDVFGNTLQELTATKIYRNDELIFTNNDPELWQFYSFTDVMDSPGMAEYKIVSENTIGSSLPYEEETWVGNDVPSAVNNLNVVNRDSLVMVSWENNDIGLHGGVYNEGIQGYHITRSDGACFDLEGLSAVYIDRYFPRHDYYAYTVIPYNSSGDGEAATSNTILYGETETIFLDSFSNGVDNWLRYNNLQSNFFAFWTILDEHSYWLGSESLGSIIAVDARERGPHNCELVLDDLVDLSNARYANIQFNNSYRGAYDDDRGIVSLSTDGGNSWIDINTWTNQTIGGENILLDISDEAAGEPDVRIKFSFRTAGFEAWWAIDNVSINVSEFLNPGPRAEVDVSTINFEETETGQSSTQLLSVFNRGSSELILAHLNSSNPEIFSVEFTSLPDTIQPGDSLNVNIMFTPSDSIEYHETLDIVSNTRLVQVTLNGEGYTVNEVNIDGTEIPSEYGISALYPNPFNPVLHVKVGLPNEAHLKLKVYDILGREVALLADRRYSSGYHKFSFNGQNLAAGMYFVRAYSPGQMNEIRKVILLK